MSKIIDDFTLYFIFDEYTSRTKGNNSYYMLEEFIKNTRRKY